MERPWLVGQGRMMAMALSYPLICSQRFRTRIVFPYHEPDSFMTPGTFLQDVQEWETKQKRLRTVNDDPVFLDFLCLEKELP
jgi:hypothetical protein